tara:strand:- start:7 stop:327 length:321 start_codon:yes stop_codon:yes gene_type:complete
MGCEKENLFLKISLSNELSNFLLDLLSSLINIELKTIKFTSLLTFEVEFFIIYNYKPNWIGKICLIYFALILARTGHYFKAEFFFFIFIYIINSLSLNQEIKKKQN